MISFSLSSILFNHGQKAGVFDDVEQNVIISDFYTPHEPIIINNNDDFSNQGWPGNGSMIDPYVIEGLNITEDAVCISISDTSIYFEINNCLITSESSSTYQGIYFENVIHGTISNCTISLHSVGIDIQYTNYSNIVNNIGVENQYPFSLIYSNYCNLTNNNATGNSQIGFRLYHSGLCILSDNLATGNMYGYSLQDSDSCIMTNNSAIYNSHYGFSLGSSDLSIFINNLAQGNAIDGYSLFYSNNCTFINNTEINSGWNGFDLYGSHFGEFINNTATDYEDYGFYIDHSNYCILRNNEATSSKLTTIGFHLYYSGLCHLSDNIATDNLYGFGLGGSDDCFLQGNIAFNNAYGFALIACGCTLIENIASSNSEYGIELQPGCENNTLYLNRLGNNGASNGRDDEGPNSWDDGVACGNYWMDYSGTGTYLIPGGASSIDHYPYIWDDGAIPTIDSPLDIEYYEATTGHSITWSPSDDHPRYYIIYRNDIMISSDSWDGSQITISVDGLSPGIYNYTLIVINASGNIISDTVFVTVLESTTTTTIITTTSTTTTTSTSITLTTTSSSSPSTTTSTTSTTFNSVTTGNENLNTSLILIFGSVSFCIILFVVFVIIRKR